MSDSSQLLRVAHPRERNNATNIPTHATTPATGAQRTGLKALALLALARNSACNSSATDPEKEAKTAQQTPVSEDQFVARPEDIRERLLAIARYEFLDDELITSLRKSDIMECEGLPHDVLLAYVLALADADLRERGKCPRDETAPALCRHCGPIWIAPEVAAMAPIVDGWARVLGCPWCHVKNRKPLPRPAVTCSACKQFQRDKINPRDGIGTCLQNVDQEKPLFPNADRKCQVFQPIGGASDGN